ncbi:unnamed protein product [Prunus brigantina]
MKCADDMKTFQAVVMEDRVYDFLASLDDTYDKVRSDILWSDKVPRSSSSVVPPRRLTSAKKDKLNKAHVAIASTSMANITTGHGHLTATPPSTLTAISSTPTPPPLGHFGKAFHAHDTRDTGWIIDSGSTDHMTYNFALFSTTLLPHHDHVLTANNTAASS